MSCYETSDLLQHIESRASGDPRRISVYDLWRAAHGSGCTPETFLEGLDHLFLDGYIEVVGDCLVLKRTAGAHPPQPRH